jgi:hypothetical protein
MVVENEAIDWGMPDFENHMATDHIDFDDDTKLVVIFQVHLPVNRRTRQET